MVFHHTVCEGLRLDVNTTKQITFASVYVLAVVFVFVLLFDLLFVLLILFFLFCSNSELPRDFFFFLSISLLGQVCLWHTQTQPHHQTGSWIKLHQPKQQRSVSQSQCFFSCATIKHWTCDTWHLSNDTCQTTIVNWHLTFDPIDITHLTLNTGILTTDTWYRVVKRKFLLAFSALSRLHTI